MVKFNTSMSLHINKILWFNFSPSPFNFNLRCTRIRIYLFKESTEILINTLFIYVWTTATVFSIVTLPPLFIVLNMRMNFSDKLIITLNFHRMCLIARCAPRYSIFTSLLVTSQYLIKILSYSELKKCYARIPKFFAPLNSV